MKKTIILTILTIILLTTIATATPLVWFPFDGSYNNRGSLGGTLTTTSTPITNQDYAKGTASLNISGDEAGYISTGVAPTNITISQWVKVLNSGSGEQIFSAYWSSFNTGIFCYTAGGTAIWCNYYNGDVNVATLLGDNNWHYLTLTYDGDTQNMSMWLDSVLVDTQIETTPPTIGNIDFGFNKNSGVDDADVLVDEPRLYDYILSQSEISSAMNETAPPDLYDWLFNDTLSDTTNTYTFDYAYGIYTNTTGTANDSFLNPALTINTSFGNDGHYAFCLWDKPLAWGGSSISLFDSNEDTQTNIQSNGDLNGGIWFVRTTAGIISDIIQNNSPSLNRWHSYCISYDTTSDILTGYIDGNDAGSITSSGTGVVDKDDLFEIYQVAGGTIGAIRYYNYTPSLSEIATWHNETFIYQAPTCNNNADCGFCSFCSGGACYNQVSTDLKDECGTDVSMCGIGGLGAFYRQGIGVCDGMGNCQETSVAVSSGNVCVNLTDYDVAPNAVVYCGIWSNCSFNQTIAPENYVGFTNSINYQCDPSNPVISGTYQFATTGYTFNQTGLFDTCSQSLKPSKFTYNAEDLAPSVIDSIAKFVVGISKIALAVGLIIGLVIFVIGFIKFTEDMAPINRRKR